MFRGKIFLATPAVLMIGLTGLPVSAATAAGATPNSCAQIVNLATCCTMNDYTVSGTSTRIPYSGVPTFKNGPGGTVTASRKYTGSVGITVTAGAESEVGAVLAKAKVSVSGAIQSTKQTDTSIEYKKDITAGKYGHLQYVNSGYKLNYSKYWINSNCSKTLLSTGTILAPTTEEGWFYWETSS